MTVYGLTILTFKEGDVPETTTQVFKTATGLEEALERLDLADNQEVDTFETLLQA